MGERNRDCIGQMASLEFIGGPHIENRDFATSREHQQRCAIDDFEFAVGMQILNDPVDVGEPGRGERAQRVKQVGDFGAGEAVEDLQALAAGFNEPGSAKHVQMARGIRGREAGVRSEQLHGFLALGEQLQDLQAVRGGQRVADTGELVEQLSLSGGGGHRVGQYTTIQLNNQVVD
jgi:hypothetical protein